MNLIDISTVKKLADLCVFKGEGRILLRDPFYRRSKENDICYATNGRIAMRADVNHDDARDVEDEERDGIVRAIDGFIEDIEKAVANGECTLVACDFTPSMIDVAGRKCDHKAVEKYTKEVENLGCCPHCGRPYDEDDVEEYAAYVRVSDSFPPVYIDTDTSKGLAAILREIGEGVKFWYKPSNGFLYAKGNGLRCVVATCRWAESSERKIIFDAKTGKEIE